VAYFAYLSFFPQKKTRKTTVSVSVGTVTATTARGYQEEWIPEHHIKKSKSGKKSGAPSGDETSGTESDVRKRRGRK